MLCEAVRAAIGDRRFEERKELFENPEWLQTCPEISAFTAKGDSFACVARKSNCGHSTLAFDLADEALPVLVARGGCLTIIDLVLLGSRETFQWRKTAASFSTMMRHFQKSKQEFCWTTNAERKTILRAAPQVAEGEIVEVAAP